MGENGKYRILQGCYWILCGVCFSYMSYYLSGYGYSAGEIGVLSATIGIISALIQPMLGRLADRSSRFGWKPQLMVLLLIGILALTMLLVCENKLLTGGLFLILLVITNCILPLLNAVCSYYESRGIHMDYGVARSCGSAAYAVMTLIIGQLTAAFGVKAIPVTMVLIPILMFLLIWSMPYEGKMNRETSSESKGDARKAGGQNNFIRKYPAFCIVLVASVLTFSVHNLTTTFLLQMLQHVGGDSSHMGVALAIAAVTEIPVMFLFTHIVKVFSPSTLLIISGVSYAVKLFLFLISGSIEMIYVVHLLQFCSYGIYAPATVRFADDCMREEDKVTGQAMMTMTTTASSVIGSLLGGWLIDSYGVPVMLFAGTVIAVIAVVFWVTGVMLYRKRIFTI